MTRLFIGPGYPIRKSPAKLARQLTEAYRSRATSFIGLQRLGIHRAPLIASPPFHNFHNAWLRSLRSSLSIHFLTCSRPFPPGLPAQVTLAAKVRRKTPVVRSGGAGGTRTPDIRLAKAALSQLSYGPTRSQAWWAMVDSNHRPRSYQDRALTS
jgi:hypothetical protein